MAALDVKARLQQAQALHAADQDAQARALLEALVPALPADLPDADRLEVLWTWADLRSHADDHAAALEAYAACEPLLQRLGRARGLVVAANNCGYHLAMTDRREEALEALRSARERSRAVGQPMLLRAYRGLAYWHLAWGQADEAESAARVAVQQARSWADAAELGEALLQLARVLARTQRTDRALLHFTEGVACLERAGQDASAAKAELAALSTVPGGAR